MLIILLTWEDRSHDIVVRAARCGFNITGKNRGFCCSRLIHQATPFHPKYRAAIGIKLDRMLGRIAGKTDAQVATALQEYVDGMQHMLKGLN